MQLGIGKENVSVREVIQSITIEDAFENNEIHDSQSANACLSALWLHHDFLDESHQISQSIPTSTGSFWHGIMHRREGDYWNSKYWFRQVENHPVFSLLSSTVSKLLDSMESEQNEINEMTKKMSWDPFFYVDMVEKYIGSSASLKAGEIRGLTISDLQFNPFSDVSMEHRIFSHGRFSDYRRNLMCTLCSILNPFKSRMQMSPALNDYTKSNKLKAIINMPKTNPPIAKWCSPYSSAVGNNSSSEI